MRKSKCKPNAERTSAASEIISMADLLQEAQKAEENPPVHYGTPNKRRPGKGRAIEEQLTSSFRAVHMPSNTPDSDATQNAFEYVTLFYTLKIPEEPREPELVTPFNMKRNSLFHSHYLSASSGICPAFLKIFHQQRTKLRT